PTRTDRRLAPHSPDRLEEPKVVGGRPGQGGRSHGRSPETGVNEAVCTPSSVPRFLAEMAIHLRPSVARRLMRPTRGLGSAPLPRRVAPHGLRPPIWPCSR